MSRSQWAPVGRPVPPRRGLRERVRAVFPVVDPVTYGLAAVVLAATFLGVALVERLAAWVGL